MTLKLIQIGNSKGIRIPKNVIDKYHLTEDLDMVETEEGILIKPAKGVRQGWDEQFKKANRKKGQDDDFSDLDSLTSDFDDSEWTW